MTSFDDLVRGYPTAERVNAAAIAERVATSGRVLVVLDDDPTGTQSVADLPVLTGWTTDHGRRRALRRDRGERLGPRGRDGVRT